MGGGTTSENAKRQFAERHSIAVITHTHGFVETNGSRHACTITGAPPTPLSSLTHSLSPSKSLLTVTTFPTRSANHSLRLSIRPSVRPSSSASRESLFLGAI